MLQSPVAQLELLSLLEEALEQLLPSFHRTLPAAMKVCLCGQFSIIYSLPAVWSSVKELCLTGYWQTMSTRERKWERRGERERERKREGEREREKEKEREKGKEEWKRKSSQKITILELLSVWIIKLCSCNRVSLHGGQWHSASISNNRNSSGSCTEKLSTSFSIANHGCFGTAWSSR